MRVNVNYTVEIDGGTRRAINIHYGREGLATREQVKRWYEHFGHSKDDDLAQLLDQETERVLLRASAVNV